MAHEPGPDALLWNDEQWRNEAEAWTRRRLGELGRAVTGTIDQSHIRPWGTAFNVPTNEGTVWFKASIPELAHEVATLEILGERGARAAPSLLAGDRGRGWMLIEDAGRSLREIEPRRVEDWEVAVATYAQLQLDVASEADSFVAAGVPDRRGPLLAEQLAALLEDERALKPPIDAALTDEEVGHLRGSVMACVSAAAEELDQIGLADSIQHDDLHDANVFVIGGVYRILDWGDACVSNPLLSIDLALRVFGDLFEIEPAASAVERVRQAYLEPFTAVRPRDELLGATAAVGRAAEACGTVKWHQISRAIPEWTRELYDEAIPNKLRRLIQLCA